MNKAMEQFIKFIKGAAPLAYWMVTCICAVFAITGNGFGVAMGLISIAATTALVLAYMMGKTIKKEEE